MTGGKLRKCFEQTASYNQLLKAGSRALAKVADQEMTSIGLLRSPDGFDFQYDTRVVGPTNTDRPINQNPFVFQDRSGQFVFVYFTGGPDLWEIRLRSAETPAAPASAED